MSKSSAVGVATMIILGVVTLIAALWAAGYYLGILGNKVQANYQKRVVTYQVQQRVRTAVFAQTAYEQFFNLCASVQSDEATLDAQYAELAQTTDPSNRDRIETNITALIAARADSINTYNAQAHEYTHGQFLDRDLPFQIDNSTYRRGTHTSCAGT